MRDYWAAKITHKTNLINLILATVLALSLSASGQGSSGLPGDYGDAPDGELSQYIVFDPDLTATFPSSFSDEVDARFIFHRNPEGSIFLGPSFTIEEDALLIDRDVDDGWFPSNFEVCSHVNLELFVQVPDNLKSEDGPFYLNALFDWNHDGRWSGASDCVPTNAPKPPVHLGDPLAQPIPLGWTTPEWGIQNLRLDQAPFNVTLGFADDILLPTLLTGPEAGEMWIRYTVTTEPIDESVFVPAALGGEGWDGQGSFEYGETEDYFSCLILKRGSSFGNCSKIVLPALTNPPTNRNEGSVADLEISIVDLIDPVVPGQNLTWLLRVRNNGPDASESVIVNDIIPAGLIFVSASVSQGSGCLLAGGGVICNLGTLTSGGWADVILTVKLPFSFRHPKITNVASVSSGGTFDPDPRNNTDNESTSIN